MANTDKDKKSEAFPEPSKAQIIEARKEGVVDAIRESTKDAFKAGADEGYGDNGSDAPRHQGAKEVAHIQDWVDLAPDELEKRVNGDGVHPITEGQIVGLLEVERSGKNRTDIVKLLCKRLKIKSPFEVTAAGPAHTNDVTRL